METNKNIENLVKMELKNNGFNICNLDGTYINPIKLFHAYFGEIPNIKSISNIDCTKTRKWIDSEMKNEINFKHYNQEFDENEKCNKYLDLFYFLKNGVLLSFCYNNVSILFLPKEELLADEIQNILLQFRLIPVRTNKIYLIVNSNRGITTKAIVLEKPKLNFELHYNDDFKQIHIEILKNIKKNKTKGLYLFHGLPGTGKSTYIKYLIHQQNKKVIFISPNMAGNLDNVELTNFLLDNQNCVLVIEDAEDLILSRDNQYNSKLSFLLNLTDGLLGESLGIQIIATFNTDLKNIDKALLRKGRLTTIYEFKELELSKTNLLMQNLGHNGKNTKPLSIADIFNFQVDTNYQPKLRKTVGFGN